MIKLLIPFLSPVTVTGIVTVAPGATVSVPIIHIPASPMTIGSVVVSLTGGSVSSGTVVVSLTGGSVSSGTVVVSLTGGSVSSGTVVVSLTGGSVSSGVVVVDSATTSIQPFCFSGVSRDMLISYTDRSSNVRSYLPGSVGAVNVTLNTTAPSSVSIRFSPSSKFVLPNVMFAILGTKLICSP